MGLAFPRVMDTNQRAAFLGIREARDSALFDETVWCLAASEALALEVDIPVEDIAARFAEYAECAAGIYCPEVAFDPIALRLRAIAMRIRTTGAGTAWTTLVCEALEAILRQRHVLTERSWRETGRLVPDMPEAA